MKVPTTGTSVFSPNLRTTTEPNFVTNFVVDSSIYNYRPGASGVPLWSSRLLGGNGEATSSTAAEVGLFGNEGYAFNTGVGTGNTANSDVLTWNLRRAPSFFDVVCYTGNGTSAARNHNLTVAPELSITKQRDGSFYYWTVIYATSSTLGNYLSLNTTDAAGSWGSTGFTATQFGLADDANTKTYVTYLFATCPAVSKVGTYTGNGTTQTINCGFGAGGARFVLIKRTDASGGWYTYDTARGMTALTDPYLLLNSTAAEVATLGSVTTVSTGFAVNATVLAAINTNAASYLFLAIA
jgi:hypothetical protein